MRCNPLCQYLVNCEYGEWGEWDPLSATCDIAIRSRFREETIQARYGGKSCDGSKNMTETIYLEACKGRVKNICQRGNCI